MRNSTGSKYVIVFALLISVAALSLGFAALTSTLTIKSSATVSTSPENFKVELSTAANTTSSGSVNATLDPSSGGPTADAATLNATTISGIKAKFTNVGQTVTYTFYARNTGEFLAYLNSVNLGSKTCTAGTGTNQSYVNAACNGITMKVKVGTDEYSTSNTSITNKTLATGANVQVQVIVNYASNASTADGDFTVAFGDTTLIYGSAD